jgi:hypothetical protein
VDLVAMYLWQSHEKGERWSKQRTFLQAKKRNLRFFPSLYVLLRQRQCMPNYPNLKGRELRVGH